MATYEFIIRDQSVGKSKSPTAPTETPKKQKQNNNGEGESPRKAAMAGYGAAKKIANTLYTHEVNMVSLRTGNAEFQERLQFHKDIIDRGFSVLESIAMGSLLAGGVGAIAGAAISLGSTAIQFAQTADRLFTTQSVENVSIGLADVRAGAMGDRQGKNI